MVYTHRDLPWRYFNHGVVWDWDSPPSPGALEAISIHMHNAGVAACFELETLDHSALHGIASTTDICELPERDISEHFLGLSNAWAEALVQSGYSVCDSLDVMAQRLPSIRPPAGASHALTIDSPPNACDVVPMPARAIRQQARLQRAGFEVGKSRPEDIDRLLVGLNLQSGVEYLWARDSAGRKPVGSAALLVADGVAEIFGLSVLPSHRSMGIGRKLLDASLNYAHSQGCSIAYLQAELHSPASALYHRAGFLSMWRQVCYSIQ